MVIDCFSWFSFFEFSQFFAKKIETAIFLKILYFPLVFNKDHLRSCRSSLLGLLAEIMCSICSCQLNIWHVGHCLATILNCFLIVGSSKEACFSLSTDCFGPTLPPGSVHQKKYRSVTLGRCDEVFRLSSLILRLYVPV